MMQSALPRRSLRSYTALSSSPPLAQLLKLRGPDLRVGSSRGAVAGGAGGGGTGGGGGEPGHAPSGAVRRNP